MQPPAASVERFRAEWGRLTGAAAGERMLVALSGGPDSTALLLLARAALGTQCTAATVDHGLRPEARREAEQAAALCRDLGVAHAILRGPAGPSTNLQAMARDMRYRLLEDQADSGAARWIATAHHADDQLETIVMRLNRASGVGGLAGVRAINGRRVRPLLGWRRAELAALVHAAGIVAVDDPSNADERFDRVRLRTRLAQADWLDPVAASASAAALAEADAALDWAAERLAGERIVVAAGTAALDPAGIPFELRRRLVLHCIRCIRADATPRGVALSRLIVTLESGRQAMIDDVIVHAIGDRWVFGAAPPRRSL